MTAVSAAAALCSTTAFAQRAPAAVAPAAARSAPRIAPARRVTDLTPHRDAPVLATAKPRSVQLVTVPVPASVPRDRAILYAITSTGAATILGRREGTLDPRSTRDPRVLVTIGVQAAALAGRSTVAEVLFSADGADPAIVPVDLEVEPLRRVSVMTSTQLVIASPGEDARVRFRVTNTGNAADTVTIRVEAPASWEARVDVRSRRIALGMLSSADGLVLVRVPRNVTGAAPILIIVEGEGGERGRTSALVEMPLRNERRSTLSFAPSFSTVLEEASVDNLGMDFRLWGPLWRSIGLDARWGRMPAVGTAGLSRLGSSSAHPQASLYGRQWRLDLGNAGASFSELAGINTYGRGAALTFTGAEWSGSTLLARPSGLAQQQAAGTQPMLVGARAQRTRGSLELSTSLTHLDNGLARGGLLDALAVGARAPWTSDGRVRGEAALRRFDGGVGLGVAGEADKRGAKGEIRLRLAHAPGGTDAFAYNRNQLSAFGSRALTARIRSNAGGWYNDDGSTRDNRRQRSSGASLSSTVDVGRGYSVGAASNVSSIALRDSMGGTFGGETRALSAFGGGRLGPVNISGSSSYSVEHRNSSVSAPDLLGGPDRRLTWRAHAVTSTPFAVASLTTWVERSIGGTSFLPSQGETQLAAQDIRIPGLQRYVTFGATVSRLGGFGGGGAIITQRYDAAALLPGGVALRLDVERNPLFSNFGRSRWSTALRIERTFDVPSFSGAGGGYVFQDLNGDGMRDRGESGIPGIILRAEGQIAVTGKDGRYRLAAADRTPPEVDERSLPFGWVLLMRRASRGRDFAVIPMSSAEVRLEINGDAGRRLAGLNLSSAGIVARDTADRMWVARMDSTGRGVFDALPPGRYRLLLDLSRLHEPLAVRGELPEIHTTSTRETIHITVPVYARPVRVWRGGIIDSAQRAPAPPLPPLPIIIADSAPALDTVLRGAPRVALPAVRYVTRRPELFRALPPRPPRAAARKARGDGGRIVMLTNTPAAAPPSTPNAAVKASPAPVAPQVHTPKGAASGSRTIWERVVDWTQGTSAKMGEMILDLLEKAGSIISRKKGE